MPQTPTGELELRDYIHVLARRKWTVVTAVFLTVGTALAMSFLQTPVYQGSAEMLLGQRSTESLFDRDANVHLGGEVEDDLGLTPGDQVARLG